MKKVRFISAVSVIVIMLSAFTFSASARHENFGLDFGDSKVDELVLRLNTAFTQYKPSCDVSDFNVKIGNSFVQDFAEKVGNLITFGCPELFHVSEISYDYNPNTNLLVDIRVEYNMTKEEYLPRLEKLRAAANQMTAGLEGKSEVEKALILHDKIALACEYATDYAVNEGEFSKAIYTAYGALVSGKAVCEGYTLAYNYLLSKVGIESRICASYNWKWNHSWNIVTIDNSEYHVDITHDDPTPDVKGRVKHDFFLVSSAKLDAPVKEGGANRLIYIYDRTPQNRRFDKSYWSDCDSPIVFDGIDCYYINSKTNTIYKNNKEFTKITDKWLFDATHAYEESQARLCLDSDGTLYVNGNKNIYVVDKSTGALTPVYASEKQIFGMSVKDGVLSLTCADNLNGEFSVATVNSSDIKLPTAPQPEIKPETDKKPVQIQDTSKVFTDIKAKKWYTNAVNYAYSYGFIAGVSDSEFGRDVPVTRGMFITVLARIAGVDTGKNANKVNTKFTDVSAGKYYTAAIKWASDNGVVNGLSATEFAPNAAIERQQLCTMIVNFAGFMKIDLKASANEMSFNDASAIRKYAKNAVKTCQMAGMVSGYENGGGMEFRPTATATRAEAAQILYKFHSGFVA